MDIAFRLQNKIYILFHLFPLLCMYISLGCKKKKPSADLRLTVQQLVAHFGKELEVSEWGDDPGDVAQHAAHPQHQQHEEIQH